MVSTLKLFKKVSLITFFVFIIMFVMSCGTRPIKFLPGQISARSEKDSGGIVTSAIWIKNKGRSIEVMMTMLNDYDKDISFEQMKMTSDGQTATASTTEFKNFLPAGGSQRGQVVFNFPEKLRKFGTGTLTIEKITFEGDKSGKALPDLKMEMPLQK